MVVAIIAVTKRPTVNPIHKPSNDIPATKARIVPFFFRKKEKKKKKKKRIDE